MTEDPELFVECQSGGWIELQDSDGHPVASLHDEYLVLAHKMKAASKMYDALKGMLEPIEELQSFEPCPMCGAYAGNYSDLTHTKGCPVPAAEAALADATIPELPPYEAF